MGDALNSGIRFFGGSGFESGKDIYENHIKQIQARSKALHQQIVNEFTGKSIPPNEQSQIDALIKRLTKTS